MSARTPRRSFATPFIITLAACGGSQPPAHSPPPQADDSEQSQELDMRWTVTRARHGKTCFADAESSCPPDAACNPPGPSAYPCPPGAGLTYPLTVITRGDHCIIVTPTPACPPQAKCNPPQQQRVPCPE